MSDYGSRAAQARSAKRNDRLVTNAAHGFKTEAEPRVPVCLMPGTTLVFTRENAAYQRKFLRFFTRTETAVRCCTLIRIETDKTGRMQDALSFANGMTVLVSDLVPGQLVTVNKLPEPQAALEEKPLEKSRGTPTPIETAFA